MGVPSAAPGLLMERGHEPVEMSRFGVKNEVFQDHSGAQPKALPFGLSNKGPQKPLWLFSLSFPSLAVEISGCGGSGQPGCSGTLSSILLHQAPI